MVQFSQTSWQEYSLANVLETLSVAPMKITVGTSPVFYYTLPQDLEAGSIVKYVVMAGFRKISWTGLISSVDNNKITVRQENGPFRGFNAIHQFEADGCMTRCFAELTFQGFKDISEDDFSKIMSNANLVYAIASRKEVQNELAILASKKQTQSFSALNQSATAG